MKKGIVIGPAFNMSPNGGVQMQLALNPHDLRKYLLYWDELDIPFNNILRINSNEIDYLEGVGVAKRTEIKFEPPLMFNSDSLLAAQEAAWRVNDTSEPGVWCMGQSAPKSYFQEGEPKDVVELELYNAVPVPSGDVPLAGILEFKADRKDELTAFRVYLDELYQGVLTAGNVPSAKSAALAKLEASIADVNRTMQEGSIRKYCGSLRSTFESEFVGLIGVGVACGLIPGITPMSPVIQGIASSGLCLAVRNMMGVKSDNGSSPLNYIQSVSRNFN